MAQPRKHLRRREVHLQPRFLTFSCIDRRPLLQNDRIKDLFAERLAACRSKYRFRLIAWVAMPEHAHLLLVPHPAVRGDVARILAGLKRPFATAVLERWRQLGWSELAALRDAHDRPVFWESGGGFDRNVRDAAEYSKTVSYINSNPVERGLVSRATDYRWSSASAYAGASDPIVPVDLLGYDAPWNWRDDVINL